MHSPNPIPDRIPNTRPIRKIWIVLLLLLILPLVIVPIALIVEKAVEEWQQRETETLSPLFLSMYRQAEQTHRVPWYLLAALHRLDASYSSDRESAWRVNGPYAREINKAALTYNVDPALIQAVIHQESGFHPRSVSPKGARGLMQLMPENCRDLGLNPDTTCLDPARNIMGGTKQISRYLKQYHGNLTLALAAYNAGPGNVKKYGGVPPFSETLQYVQNVPELYRQYQQKRDRANAPRVESIKRRIFDLAHHLRLLSQQHGQSLQRQQPTGCMAQISRHSAPRLQHVPDHEEMTLRCAVYSIKKDWKQTDRVIQLANQYRAQWSPPAAAISPLAKQPTEKLASAEFLWPAPTAHQITSQFQPRRKQPITGKIQPHYGIDVGTSGRLGQPAVAAKAGRVTQAGWASGYGNLVVIDHGGGFSTAYGHLAKILVSKGQQVRQGETIGLIGSTGISTGPHLHFEIRVNGVSVDPLRYFGRQ